VDDTLRKERGQKQQVILWMIVDTSVDDTCWITLDTSCQDTLLNGPSNRCPPPQANTCNAVLVATHGLKQRHQLQRSLGTEYTAVQSTERKQPKQVGTHTWEWR
jgi:hypothetical protein